MNWWAKTILVLGLATLASGCSSNSPKPTPASTSGASETATTAPPTAEPTRIPPTIDPKAPTGGPPPANYPPPRPKPSAADQATLATDPLVVYADEVGSTLFNGRNWPVVEVVSYNLRTGRWSPDGSTLLFHTLPIVSEPTRPGGECFQDESPPAWKTWSASGIHDVPDLRALLQQWDGPRFIDLICNGAPIVMEYPLNAGYLVCENSANTPPATLVIGGKPIDQIHQAAVAGFID